MKKIIVKLVSLVLLCVVVILSLNYLFMTYDGRYTYRMMSEMYCDEENIDAVFLGSSHAYTSIDPEITDRLMKCHTFNAGSSVQGMNTSYHMLVELMKYHKPRTVFLDTNQAVMHVANSDKSVFYITDYMLNSKNKYDLLKSGGNETVFNGYVTFRRNFRNLNIFSNVRSRFVPVSDYSSVTYDDAYYKGRGFVFNDNCEEITKESVDKLSADFNSFSNIAGKNYEKYFNEIVELCKSNNIELILIEHPACDTFLKEFSEYGECIKYFQKVAEENDIQYWNFNLYKNDMGLKDTDFRDVTHLNGYGAEKYSKALGEVAYQHMQGKDVSSLFKKSL